MRICRGEAAGSVGLIRIKRQSAGHSALGFFVKKKKLHRTSRSQWCWHDVFEPSTWWVVPRQLLVLVADNSTATCLVVWLRRTCRCGRVNALRVASSLASTSESLELISSLVYSRQNMGKIVSFQNPSRQCESRGEYVCEDGIPSTQVLKPLALDLRSPRGIVEAVSRDHARTKK